MTVSISAMVTAPPGKIRKPIPLPGESIVQVVIRNFADEWAVFLDNMRAEFSLDAATMTHLKRGAMPGSIVGGSPLAERIQVFVNRRIPLQGRTVSALAELRDSVKSNPPPDPLRSDRLYRGRGTPYEIGEIIIPRQGDIAAADPRQTRWIEALGVRQIQADSPIPGLIDFNRLIAQVRGDFMWIVAGGTTFFTYETSELLGSVMGNFAGHPKLALYSDQCYCTVYRMTALRQIMDSGKKFSGEVQGNARMLSEAGYEMVGNPNAGDRLAYLERCYGGEYGVVVSGKSWWRRLFGG